MKILYVVHPGWITSANDGDSHFIGFPALCRLYELDPNAGHVVDASAIGSASYVMAAERAGDVDIRHRWPHRDGNYPSDG